MTEKELRRKWFDAAAKGDSALIERLSKADSTLLNAQNSTGNTALHVASREGHFEVIAFLFPKVDTTLKNQDGQTAADLSKARREKQEAQKNSDELDALLQPSPRQGRGL